MNRDDRQAGSDDRHPRRIARAWLATYRCASRSPTACREINRLRSEQNAFVFAIDLPTGLDGDTGDADADCVVADFTITIGFAKQGLLADRALDFVGRLEVVPLRPRSTQSGTEL